VESDTWEGKENLKNTKEAIEEFKKEYQRDIEDMARQECEKGTYRRGELLGRFTTKKLFRWSDKRYDQEYWGRLEKNWRWWKGKRLQGRKMKMIEEEEEIEEEKSGSREWTEEDDKEIGNMVDPYYEL